MNAKQELLDHLEDSPKLRCAIIEKENNNFDLVQIAILKLNYTEQEYQDFLKLLDFEYDNGYGGQELFGTIWLEEGEYLDRGEYDGSEWWEHHRYPDIPKELE